MTWCFAPLEAYEESYTKLPPARLMAPIGTQMATLVLFPVGREISRLQGTIINVGPGMLGPCKIDRILVSPSRLGNEVKQS